MYLCRIPINILYIIYVMLESKIIFNNLKSREQYIKENNAQKVLNKLKSKDLPKAKGLDCKNSQVGSYLSDDDIVELYGEDFNGILDQLGKGGMLVYKWNNENAWWQKKGDGVVRVQ